MLNPIRIGELGLKRLLRFLWRKRYEFLKVIWCIAGCYVLMSLAFAVFYWFGACHGLEDVNKAEARIQMGNFKQSLDTYYVRQAPHEYPRSLDELVDADIMQSITRDPWGQRYVYFTTSHNGYVLVSAGEDGKVATEDDIALGVDEGTKWTDVLVK